MNFGNENIQLPALRPVPLCVSVHREQRWPFDHEIDGRELRKVLFVGGNAWPYGRAMGTVHRFLLVQCSGRVENFTRG